MSAREELHKWKVGDPITANLLNQLREAIPHLQAGAGITISRAKGQATIAIDTREPRPKRTFWARITGAQAVNTNQWRYTAEEAAKLGPGHQGWQTKPGGRTGDAYNLRENANDGSGLEDDGIDHDRLPGTFAMQPAPTGALVLVTIVTHNEAGTQHAEWWFDYRNSVDGTC